MPCADLTRCKSELHTVPYQIIYLGARTNGNKKAPRPYWYNFFQALEVIFPEREASYVDDHKLWVP